MAYVIGVDLGTSAVKVLLVDQKGEVVATASEDYPLSQPHPGFSEQNPEDWVIGTKKAIKMLLKESKITADEIEGLSYSGQMHGLVLLDEQQKVLRPAILWNDTRTSAQCEEIRETMDNRFVEITRNKALEGFTLPKILWVKENEPDIFAQASVFLLPKDYVRLAMTGKIGMDYSDAAGTVMLDVVKKEWSTEICETFGIPSTLCPSLIESVDCVGPLLPEFAQESGLKTTTQIFGGGADNACGAIGAGILDQTKVLSSIGTSGVVLAYEESSKTDYQGDIHFFNHGIPNAYYSMGVTLAAGFSLSWFKKTFAPEQDFTEMVESAQKSRVGANGLLFTPYIVGERTPYADAKIRGSFIGVDSTQTREDFVRAVLEGIIFSFADIMKIYRTHDKEIQRVVSIGGGAKSPLWLQIQADIFNAEVVSLKSEQGPGMGAAMLAAVGLGWFDSLADCAQKFVQIAKIYQPIPENVQKYAELHLAYQAIYPATKAISEELYAFRA